MNSELLHSAPPLSTHYAHPMDPKQVNKAFLYINDPLKFEIM